MAKQEKPTKGSQRETSVQGNPAEGLSFADLIRSATGSEVPSKKEFESAMTARGYRSADVRKLVKAFDQVTGSGKDYFLRDEGFDVYEGGARESGSGQAKGNKAGSDLGDLVGLGNNVSLLAGALRNEKPAYERKKAEQNAYLGNETVSGKGAQSLSPEQQFAVTMSDLIGASASGQSVDQGQKPNAGGTNGTGTTQKGGKKGSSNMNQKTPAGYQPMQFDQDLLNWSPKDVLRGSPFGFFDGEQGGEQGGNTLLNPTGDIMDPMMFMGGEQGQPSDREQKIAQADKDRELTWDNITSGKAFTSLANPYAWASATENLKGVTSGGGQAFAMASPFINNPALQKVYNRYMLPFNAMATGADWAADAFTDEGTQGDEMLSDVIQTGVNTIGVNAAPWIRGKFSKAKGLEQTMRQNARAARPSRFSWPSQMASKVKFPGVERQPAGFLTSGAPRLGTGTSNPFAGISPERMKAIEEMSARMLEGFDKGGKIY